MHIKTSTTYQSVCEVVVSYLQAKQVWKPSAAYAGAAARNDPDAMEIGQIGHGKGKGKGKDGNGKAGKKGKEKKQKGQAKIATAAERVAKAVTAKTDAPSAGKQAIQQRSVGSTRKAEKRAKGRSSFQQSLRVTHPRLSLLGPRHLKWEETVYTIITLHPRRNTNSRKVLVRSGNTDFSWSRPSKSCRAASRALSPLWQNRARFHNLRPLWPIPKERICNLVMPFWH